MKCRAWPDSLPAPLARPEQVRALALVVLQTLLLQMLVLAHVAQGALIQGPLAPQALALHKLAAEQVRESARWEALPQACLRCCCRRPERWPWLPVPVPLAVPTHSRPGCCFQRQHCMKTVCRELPPALASAVRPSSGAAFQPRAEPADVHAGAPPRRRAVFLAAEAGLARGRQRCDGHLGSLLACFLAGRRKGVGTCSSPVRG